MKKIAAMMLAAMLLLLTVTAQAASSSWIGEKQARSLGQKYLKERGGMTESDYQTYEIVDAWKSTLADGTPLWNIHFFGDRNDPRYATNAYIVYVHGYSGEFRGMEYPTVPNPVTAEFNRLRNEVYKKDFVLWTIEQKYDFGQTFPQMYKDFEYLAMQEDTNYLPISDHLKQLLQYDFRLPDEQCISQDDAIGLAKEALKKAEKLDDKHIDKHYMNSTSFLFSHQFSSAGRSVWKIFFIPTPPVSPDYGYFVEIDAFSGDTVGIVHQIQSQENPWALVYE